MYKEVHQTKPSYIISDRHNSAGNKLCKCIYVPLQTKSFFCFERANTLSKKCLETTQNSHGHTLQAKRTSFLNNAHSRKVGVKHCKRMVSTYKHMGKLQSAITLILRCDQKSGSNIFLVSGHSACRCERCGLKCFTELKTHIY